MYGLRLKNISVMDIKYSIHYDEKQKVVIEKYRDKVSLNDVISSWEKMIKSDSLPGEARGLVLDCGNAHLDFPASEHQKIVEYYRKNIEFFGKYKIGFVANTPHNIVIVMLVAQADSRYYLRPFTSLKAALEWAGC